MYLTTLQRMMIVEAGVRERSKSSPRTLEEFASRHAASPPLRIGKSAAGCAWRYRDLGVSDPFDDGFTSFARAVVNYSFDELLGREGAKGRRPPMISWFANASDDEPVDFGNESGPVPGWYHSYSDTIWLHEDLRGRKLVEITAHEACHAAKHRGRKSGADTEAEAMAFAEVIADRWRVPPNDRCSELRIVPICHAMPSKALTDAVVLDCGSATIYLNTGTLREPRWSVLSEL